MNARRKIKEPIKRVMANISKVTIGVIMETLGEIKEMEEIKELKLIKTEVVVTLTTLVITFFALICFPEKMENYRMVIISGFVALVGLFFALVACLSKDDADIPSSPGFAVFIGAIFAFIYTTHHSIFTIFGKKGFLTFDSVFSVIFILFFVISVSTFLMKRRREIISVLTFFLTILVNFGILWMLYEISKLSS